MPDFIEDIDVFREKIGEDTLTIIDFTATWCGPCKDFKPIILELISEGYNITVHDVDQEQNLPTQYNVNLIPTTVIEENGVEVDRFVGALPKLLIIQKLKR